MLTQLIWVALRFYSDWKETDRNQNSDEHDELIYWVKYRRVSYNSAPILIFTVTVRTNTSLNDFNKFYYYI